MGKQVPSAHKYISMVSKVSIEVFSFMVRWPQLPMRNSQKFKLILWVDKVPPGWPCAQQDDCFLCFNQSLWTSFTGKAVSGATHKLVIFKTISYANTPEQLCLFQKLIICWHFIRWGTSQLLVTIVSPTKLILNSNWLLINDFHIDIVMKNYMIPIINKVSDHNQMSSFKAITNQTLLITKGERIFMIHQHTMYWVCWKICSPSTFYLLLDLLVFLSAQRYNPSRSSYCKRTMLKEYKTHQNTFDDCTQKIDYFGIWNKLTKLYD